MELDKITVSEVMEREVVSVHEKEPLSSVIGKMKETGIHELPVVDSKGVLKGIFSYRMIVRRRNLPIYSKVGSLLLYPPTITPDESLSSAMEKMLNTGHRALPVVDGGGRVVGMLTRRAVIKLIRRDRNLANIPVEDVMSRDPVVVRENDSVDVAIEKMRSLGEVALPVVDAHGHLRGVVMLRDIARSYWREKERESYGEVVGEKERKVIPVSEVMVAPAYVRIGSRLREVIDEMESMDVYLTIVVDEDMVPVGVITDKDIVETLYSSLPQQEGVFVQITGLDIEDPEPYDYIYSLVEPFLQKLYKTERLKPQILTFHVERHEVGGKESKYSVRARLGTDRKTFYAKGVDWNLFRAVREAMENLERMVMKEKKRIVEMAKTIH